MQISLAIGALYFNDGKRREKQLHPEFYLFIYLFYLVKKSTFNTLVTFKCKDECPFNTDFVRHTITPNN